MYVRWLGSPDYNGAKRLHEVVMKTDKYYLVLPRDCEGGTSRSVHALPIHECEEVQPGA